MLLLDQSKLTLCVPSTFLSYSAENGKKQRLISDRLQQQMLIFLLNPSLFWVSPVPSVTHCCSHLVFCLCKHSLKNCVGQIGESKPRTENQQNRIHEVMHLCLESGSYTVDIILCPVLVDFNAVCLSVLEYTVLCVI